jgi:hypothetical protein
LTKKSSTIRITPDTKETLERIDMNDYYRQRIEESPLNAVAVLGSMAAAGVLLVLRAIFH